MGECIITRAAGEAEAALPISPGYHTIGVTLKGPDGKAMVNWPIICNDGTQSYNYKTNEKGQTIFMVNSGAGNIFVNNSIDGYLIKDMDSPGWTNIDAPVGLSTRVNINFNFNGTSFFEFTSNTSFGFYYAKNISNLILVGGGGGGGWSYGSSSSYSEYAGGGGAGYLNQYNDIYFDSNSRFKFIAGSGGIGGDENSANGGSGGTSYIVGTSYSAVGGSGGLENNMGGVGGLGNGGGRNDSWGYNGENSSVDFAGGGGGGSKTGKGGSPYGGNAASTTADTGRAWFGSRGGGGGGIHGGGYGGAGGSGLMRINIHY